WPAPPTAPSSRARGSGTRGNSPGEARAIASRTSARALPAHDVLDLAGLHVVDEAGDHPQRGKVRGAGEQLDVLLQGGGVVVDREEAEVGTRPLLQLVVAHAG